MAARQKAVESTAMQVRDLGFHAQEAEALRESFQMTIQKEGSEATDLADLSVKVQTVREDLSVKTEKEEVSVETDHAGHLEKALTVREDRSQRAKKEEDSATTVQDVLPETIPKEKASVETDRAGHSVRVLKERVSAETGKADSETPARRASTEGTSTISVMRMRAESAR